MGDYQGQKGRKAPIRDQWIFLASLAWVIGFAAVLVWLFLAGN
jgi:hypothetical protein